MQISRAEVPQYVLDHSQPFLELQFSLLPHVSLALHEPPMEVVTCLEKYDETY